MLTQSLRALAPYLAWDPVVYMLLAALGIWALASAIMFQQATARVRHAVRAAERRLGPDDPVAFTALYEQVSADFAHDRIVGPGWRGLRQGLIIPSEAGRPVVSTTDMRDWFHLAELYRAAGGDLRYHAALPGLLVGAGLLVDIEQDGIMPVGGGAGELRGGILAGCRHIAQTNDPPIAGTQHGGIDLVDAFETGVSHDQIEAEMFFNPSDRHIVT